MLLIPARSSISLNTETLKMLFTGSETKVASSGEAEKALGYSFANEVLVDHPYRWDDSIEPVSYTHLTLPTTD